MARSIPEIQRQLLSEKANHTALNGLDSTSKTSLWRLLFYIVAMATQTLERLFDRHKIEVKTLLAQQKAGTLAWYRTRAKDFLYGIDLKPDSDQFKTLKPNRKPYSEEEIDKAKIIQYAAISEANSDNSSRLVIKVATEQNEAITPLSQNQKLALETYFEDIKYAGTNITIISTTGDRLYLRLDIYYDPLVLNHQGVSIVSGEKPVEKALEAFLKNLPFDGALIVQSLTDAVQVAHGVDIVHVLSVQTAQLEAKGYGTPQQVAVKNTPASGYFRTQWSEMGKETSGLNIQYNVSDVG